MMSDQAIVDGDVELDLRICVGECWQDRTDQQARRVARHVDTQAADRRCAVAIELIDGRADGLKALAKLFRQRAAGRGRHHRAAGAIEQLHAQPRFEIAHGVA
jgi:hypothetical protein